MANVSISYKVSCGNAVTAYSHRRQVAFLKVPSKVSLALRFNLNFIQKIILDAFLGAVRLCALFDW